MTAIDSNRCTYNTDCRDGIWKDAAPFGLRLFSVSSCLACQVLRLSKDVAEIAVQICAVLCWPACEILLCCILQVLHMTWKNLYSFLPLSWMCQIPWGVAIFFGKMSTQTKICNWLFRSANFAARVAHLMTKGFTPIRQDWDGKQVENVWCWHFWSAEISKEAGVVGKIRFVYMMLFRRWLVCRWSRTASLDISWDML